MSGGEVRLQALAVLGAYLGTMVVLVGLALLGYQPGSEWSVIELVLLVAFYVVAVAGAHLYLAARGRGGTVPVVARWRFVGAVTAVTVLLGLAQVATGLRSVAGLEPSAVLAVLGFLLGLGYVAYEALDGYRAAREGQAY